MGKGIKQVAFGTMIAGVAGYVAGVLTAPKSGRDTREQIKTATVHSVNESEKQLKKLHTELSDLVLELKHQSREVSGQAKQGLHEAQDLASDAKLKVREILSAVHEGDADDKDLDRAVTEASKAIKHIRKYLKK